MNQGLTPTGKLLIAFHFQDPPSVDSYTACPAAQPLDHAHWKL